jgi:two-component system chemotaxis sensor kinase CheA
MTDRDAFSLIFMPGFSTAEKVTSVSGRGVGMDVVRTNIQKLKGIIEVDSKIGAGTTFTIKLPLTLAIIQGLLVRVHSEIYALPLSAVVEVVNTDLNQIYSVNQNEVIRIRNQVFPLIRMDKVLKTPTSEDTLENRYVVVVGLADKRLGLVVDELLGQKEIVIKSLGEYLGHIRGMSGSTILGDGRVIMILDIEELIQAAHTITASVWQQQG